MSDQEPQFISITPMKNEGPFVLEWVAHNLAIGMNQIVVMTNDCTDGTDAILARLDNRGIVTHVDNTSRRATNPQKRAYKKFLKMGIASEQDWVLPVDADEQINIKTGDNTLKALIRAVPEAKMFSLTWRLFGNAGVMSFEDRFLSDQFRRAAPEHCPRPSQAWGLKTMFQRGLWGHIGVHRPKRPKVRSMSECNWFNGSGQPMPDRYFTGSWRSGRDSVGYELAQVNHYALKSCESYLVKKLRGRAHHRGESLGLQYWNRMNQNATDDRSIDAIAPQKRAIFEELMWDQETARLHRASCKKHRDQIEELRSLPEIGHLLNQMTQGIASEEV